MSAPQGFDPFWMRLALGRPETCTEGIDRRGTFDTCDKVAVGLRLDPEEQEPYPVCARHARADMVPLEAIVRFMLDREQTQQIIARGLLAMAVGAVPDV